MTGYTILRGFLLLACTSVAAAAEIQWTDSEKTYLSARDPIILGLDPEWPPYSFVNPEEEIVGIDRDILDLIEQHTGLTFEILPTDSWAETYALAKEGKISVLSGMSRSPEREKHFSFTAPYLSFPLAIISRQEQPLILDIRLQPDLLVALPSGHITTERFQQDYSDHPLKISNSSRESMEWVSRRQADITMENLVTATAIIRQQGLTNLKIAGVSSYQFDLHFAVNPAEQELVAILNKALEHIGEQERLAIYNRWIEVERDDWIVWEKVWRVAVAILLVLLTMIFVISIWNRFLASEIQRRKEAEAKLQSANRLKDRMMAMLAHDLNNPLTVLRLMLEQVEGSRNDEPIIEKMSGMITRMSQLVRQMLTLKSLEHSGVEKKVEEVNLSRLLIRLMSEYQTQADKKNIRLTHSVPNLETYLWTNREAMIQILENLISNAIKFSHAETTVHASLRDLEQSIELKIKDEGPGLSEADQEKLFSGFTKLSTRPTEGEHSTGLGLSIAHELIQELEGSISCESAPRQGCAFTVTLPKMEPKSAED
ncbi:MAG: transporter substrate-binding domain-containing protein [Verrucomicrobiota bacterium]